MNSSHERQLLQRKTEARRRDQVVQRRAPTGFFSSLPAGEEVMRVLTKTSTIPRLQAMRFPRTIDPSLYKRTHFSQSLQALYWLLTSAVLNPSILYRLNVKKARLKTQCLVGSYRPIENTLTRYRSRSLSYNVLHAAIYKSHTGVMRDGRVYPTHPMSSSIHTSDRNPWSSGSSLCSVLDRQDYFPRIRFTAPLIGI